jgi:hypothetical protein
MTNEEVARQVAEQISKATGCSTVEWEESLEPIILAAMNQQGVSIALTRGRFAVVSPEDADLSLFDWHCTSHGRAAKGKSEYMHKLIGERMGLSGEIDHIDGNPLNNRRSNLRSCTRSQNEANAPKHTSRGDTSKYKGVCKRGDKWIAQIKSNGKMRQIGRFSDEDEAAKAYDKAALETFGEFARLNFPAAQPKVHGRGYGRWQDWGEAQPRQEPKEWTVEQKQALVHACEILQKTIPEVTVEGLMRAVMAAPRPSDGGQDVLLEGDLQIDAGWLAQQLHAANILCEGLQKELAAERENHELQRQSWYNTNTHEGERRLIAESQLLQAQAAIAEHDENCSDIHCGPIGTDDTALQEHDEEVRRPLVDLLRDARPVVANAAGDLEASPWQVEFRIKLLARIDATLAQVEKGK